MNAAGASPAVSGEVLRVIAGPAAGTDIPLGHDVSIGRAVQGPGALGGDEELSRAHARVVLRGDGAYLLEDLGSTNGTYLNGWRIPASQLLSTGDRIQVGQTVLEVVLAPDPQHTAMRRRPVILAGTPDAEELRTPRSQATLYVSGVRKSYGDFEVLKGVDLEIEPGEVAGLLGHNGAGKTTFVSCVAGLRRTDSGTILVNGVDAVAEPLKARQHLGIAPQDLGIYPTLTVRGNLELFGELGGLRGRDVARRAEEVGEALSLTPKFDAAAGTLSGGQQRRLHTGMAIVCKPALLILDEPTVGADIRTRQEILDLVKGLAEEGHAVCYSTHYLPEIEQLGASVALLQGGAIIARGSIAELVAMNSTQVVELTFDGPAPEISVRGGEVVCDGPVLRISTDNAATMAAAALGQLGGHTMRLRNIELVRPSLDSIYLTLTEQRYSSEEPGAGGSADGDRDAPIVSGAALQNSGVNFSRP
ncbi:MAG TPA: ATP-binding cassette domain-containing protein [Solirubrobacteraceae bacterium]|jgi:ABC-2 type transport system ATP-binding protein|nr:ATP-binding cassette domain-containing protein [Solirubrobacteraceae bacterium]